MCYINNMDKHPTLMNTYAQLDSIIEDLQSSGLTVKITRLPMSKPKRRDLMLTSGHRTTGYRVAGVKIRGGDGHNCGNKVG